MRHFYPLRRQVPLLIAISVALLLAALAMNTLRQARTQARSLAGSGAIAVFLASAPAVSSSTVTEDLLATGWAARTEYVSRQQAYEMAAGAGSPLRDYVTPGENPFSAYVRVWPRELTAVNARFLADEALKVPGVTDARFDERLFVTIERLAQVAKFYETALWLAVVVLALIVAFRETNTLIIGAFDIEVFLMLLVRGAIGGAAAAAAYALLSWYCGMPSVVVLPAPILLMLVPGGMLLSAAFGHKR